MKTKLIFIIFAMLLFPFLSCEKDSEKAVDTTLRTKIMDDYKTIYLQTEVTDLAWTGNAANCDAGVISADAQNKILKRINYFRVLVGLTGDVIFDNVKNSKCQQAALMSTANGQLNHFPPTTWKCYTADGKEASGSSNLYLGVSGSNAITGYINDPGTSNNACGHRRWILYSIAKTMGHGSTTNADALWVTGGSQTPATLPEFIAYPPKGFVPAPLVYAKWSFGIPAANFANATVEMLDQNKAAITLSVISKTDNGYGDNTIIWQPAGIVTTSTTDVTYTVNVKNVKVGGVAKDFSYDVIIMLPE